MTESFLSTKLYVPSIRPELVQRPRLIAQLNEGLHHALTLISAPAGFGKTSLVTDWIGGLRQNNNKESVPAKKSAWLSLDEADNDLARFLIYFINAIRQGTGADVDLGKTALSMLENPQLPPTEMILTSLINDLSSADYRIILVLDDYHIIEDQSIHKALNFWIDNAPPQMQLVILTREDPHLPLARLRARDQLTELRAADLRFTEQEAGQFLNEIMGLHLDAGSVALLKERTEGWITGLQMAALSMRDRKDVNGFIESFSGTNRYILDYLLEEVLANQPPTIQRFLLKTSVLKRLSAPLCEAVLANDGDTAAGATDSESFLASQSTSILEYLERANLFLLPLDAERKWYRYHHLFADLLRAHLALSTSREEMAEMHARASQWYEENNMAYAAIHHASLIPDEEWVERLIDQNYMEIFQRRDSGSIRHWTGELSKSLISKRPGLSIHEAMSRAWLGQLDDAELLLDQAEKQLRVGSQALETKDLLGSLAYVRSRVTAMRGDFRQAIELCLTARENTPASNEGLLGGIGVMLGYGYFLAGDFAKAIDTLDETIRTGKVSGAVNTTIGAYCVLARLYAVQGQLHKSYALYRDAENFIITDGGQHHGAMSIIDVGIADVLYEWNDLEKAHDHMKQGLEFIPLWAKADDIALAYTRHSQIQQAQGYLAAAAETMEKGSQVIRSSGIFPEARDAVLMAEIKMGLKKEYSPEVSHWTSSLEERFSQKNPFRFENELALITLARAYIAQNKMDKAMEILDQLAEKAQSGARKGRLIEIMNLKALALQNLGDTQQAVAVLIKSLELAEPEGYIRIFLDEGQPMQQLLAQYAANYSSSPLRDYVNHLLAQFSGEQDTALAGQTKLSSHEDLPEPLSAREIEVLQQIALGKTNKEIANILVVSPGTIKAHTSSIYRKLDVNNRTEAVARARELRVLP